ncbi:ABC transporter, ATPase subunit [Lentisphaera araneosa HTCC2155]|uniref:ABC transporter, ATPase subunit n=1 Tax=Lentisphaera araneosa HTCC2155 TaxID=313628 RepID=A6DJQ3_9BACT|nr:ABC transporter ATP-binding protein [Lentisphaera araneosa]EDM28127.1 ABC transporter, ATPase subunit [Lentisphaera araneosa HTCC2155]
MTNSIEIKQASKAYQRKNQTPVQALDKLDLKAESGDFIAVLGPSGCGKSTLMLSAGGLLEVDSGQVVINGQDLSQLSSSQKAEFRAKNVAYVYQEFHLIPYLNVIDNVRIADLALGSGSEQKAEEILKKFGLAERAQHLPSELSVGEQQRVALSRAIYSGAKIILADEPTGNLDSENAETVLKALKDFTEEGGIVIMVTHDDRAVAYAAKKLSMSAGQWSA